MTLALLLIPLMGFVVSAISIFMGLGGGVMLVPLLPDAFGLSTHEALATSVFTVFLVVSYNTHKFHGKAWIHWPVVFLMGPLGALTALVASWWARQAEPRFILMILLGILSLVALRTFFSSFLKKPYVALPSLGPKAKLGSMLGGALAGMTSGLAGVGAGIIYSPVMILLRSVSSIQLSPTTNANMMFSTLGASLSFILAGRWVSWNQWGLIRWDLALGIFLSAVFFNPFLAPHQYKLGLRTKSFLLSLLLFFLMGKVLHVLLSPSPT